MSFERRAFAPLSVRLGRSYWTTQRSPGRKDHSFTNLTVRFVT